MTHRLLMLGALALLAAPIVAAPAKTKSPTTPADAIAAAPAGEWRPISANDLVIFDLAPDTAGNKRRFVLQLLPDALGSPWTRNVRTLARAGFWDGTSIYRVQDNWVTQWGDFSEKKAMPATLVPTARAEFDWPWAKVQALVDAGTLAASRTRARKDFRLRDPYAPLVGYVGGLPIGSDGKRAWPLHCYASVGVARGTDNAGTGSELYAVIGQAPRQLDRNIGVAGRIVEGMEYLSALPRGGDKMGFYAKDQVKVPIVRARIASDLPVADQPKLEYLDPESASFRTYADLAANRHDDFYLKGAGGMDICNLKVPIRPMPAK